MTTKTLKQTIVLKKTSPEELYSIFLDAKKHSQIVGGPVQMSNEVGGFFNVFDGYCIGSNVSLKEPVKIVQDWNFKEKGWPVDYYTRCTFEFEKTKDGTIIHFEQKDIPPHKAQDLLEGWIKFYWEPIRKMVEKKK